MPQWLIYIIIALVLIIFFLAWAWFQRMRYNKAVEGKMLCEFWPETGMRYKELLPVEVNGIEVKSPKGHQCPRYFFDKNSTYTARFPDDPFLSLKFLQVDVPINSWPENNPEPINPYRDPIKPIATSALIDSLRDNDFAAFAMAANKQIQELEEALAKALINSVQKKTLYIGAGVISIIALIAVILSYLNYGAISELTNQWVVK